VNVTVFGLAKIEDAASTLAVNENCGFRVGALLLCFGLPVLPFKEHVFGMAVRLPCGSLRGAEWFLAFLFIHVFLNKLMSDAVRPDLERGHNHLSQSGHARSQVFARRTS